MKLLEVNNLKVYFYDNFKFFKAVDGISFSIHKGEFFTLIGESGSGKTTTALSIVGLIESSPGMIQGGINFNGVNLLDDLDSHTKIVEDEGQIIEVTKDQKWEKKYQKRMNKIRGQKISMIFQEPASSLDPYFTIGEQFTEVLLEKYICRNGNETREIIEYWLDQVAIKNPKTVIENYPHELSGGMSQRVMIALALCVDPILLIADEPTTALDVTIQKEILLLLQSLRDKFNLTILFITHDISLVKSMADRIAVLYKGRLLECGTSADFFNNENNNHPFTENLIIPVTKIMESNSQLRLQSSFISTKYTPDIGCIYYPECIPRLRKCKELDPPKSSLSESHRLYCWLYESQ